MAEFDLRCWHFRGSLEVVSDAAVLAELGSAIRLAWKRDPTRLYRRVRDQWSEVSEEQIVGVLFEVFSNGSPEGLEPRHNRRPFLVFASDDGAMDDLMKLAPLAVDKQCTFVLGIVRDFVGQRNGVGYMDRAQIDQMVALGCEVAAHGVSHPRLAALSTVRQRYEVEESVRWLRDQGWGASHFVYPYGSHTVFSERIVGSLCWSACIVSGGIVRPPFLRTRLPRHAFGSFFERGVKTFAGYQALVDDVVRERGLLIWMLHPWSEQHDASQQAMLGDIIDYARSEGATIGTLTEALAEHGNLFETEVGCGNEWVVDADGNVWQSEIPGGLIGALAQRAVDTRCFEAARHAASKVKGALRLRALRRPACENPTG